MPKRVLSVDGGGSYGLLPALWLAEIEKRTGKRCADLFDLIAGTSTGGIIASGLSIGLAAASLALLYHDHGSEIFRASLWNKARGLDGLSGPKYSAATLERYLAQALGDKTLSDAQTHLLVPTTRCDKEGGPFWFKSWEGPNFLLRDVARATSAAPVYFPPAVISPVDGEPMVCVDGGIHANSPEDFAALQASKLWPGEEIIVVSLGTGYEPVDVEAKADWGAADWVMGGLLDLVMICSEINAATRGQMIDYRRARLDVEIGGNMDDASAANISAMTKAAQKVIAGADFAAMLDLLADKVSA